jgi:HSP20 family protein
MSLTRYRPVSERPTQALSDLLERYMEPSLWGTGLGPQGWQPPVNIAESPEEFVISMEIPGVDPKAVNVSITADVVTISGTREREAVSGNVQWHRIECAEGSFSRSFRLGGSVNPDKVSADCRNGLLRIALPKSDESRTRAISVQSV